MPRAAAQTGQHKIRPRTARHFTGKRQTIGYLNLKGQRYLNTDPCLIDYYHDREFLQPQGMFFVKKREEPEVRVYERTEI